MARWGIRIVLGVGVLAACGGVLPGCWFWEGAATFELHVVPAAVADLAQGASTLFLVSIEEIGNEPAPPPVTLTATAATGTASIAPSSILEGSVGEVTVNSAGVPVGSAITVTIQARRGAETREVAVTATVTDPIELPDDRQLTGTEMRERFVPWLAAEYPELGIDENTVWTAMPVRPHILVVSFYIFLCEEWEFVVWWHVMIPPYDWARMYLRHRSTETVPSFWGEIGSVSSGTPPQLMAPDEGIWR